MKKLILLLLVITAASYAQKKDPQKLIDAVNKQFAKVNDYKADVEVKLDMEFVKVPKSKAKVFFKQPNKFKIESDGFAMLPKQSMDFSPMQMLKGDYTPLYVRSENIKGKNYDVIKLIPNSDTTDIILSTLWIELKNYVVEKLETSTKRGGTVVVTFDYQPKTIPLPTVLNFSFNLGEVNIPNQSDNSSKDKNQNQMGRATKIKGSVVMTYSNYQINKGIPDSFFIEKK